MLEIMVKIGRAKASELALAKAVLGELLNPLIPPEPIVEIVPGNDIQPPMQLTRNEPIDMGMIESVFRKKGELMTEIKRLTAEQNELSNRLHEIDTDQDCPGITRQIVSLRKTIEELWSDYRFIERNGVLPEKKAETVAEPVDPLRELKLLQIGHDLKRLRDIRLKLEKKLEKPHLHTKSPELKVPEWQTALIKVQEEISDLELQKDAF